MLYIVESYYCVQFQGKLMNQTWENDKTPNFKPDFAPLAQMWVQKLFFVEFTLYTLSRKTNKQNLRKWQKNLVSGQILAHVAQIQAAKFF